MLKRNRKGAYRSVEAASKRTIAPKGCRLKRSAEVPFIATEDAGEAAHRQKLRARTAEHRVTGKVERKADHQGTIYVIQKHWANHHHYDFQLEWGEHLKLGRATKALQQESSYQAHTAVQSRTIAVLRRGH
jgi:hypothetical protein